MSGQERALQQAVPLRAEGLCLAGPEAAGALPLLRSVDLDLPAGRITVLLGETGAGKTLLARALSGLLPVGVRRTGGRVCFRGHEMADADWAKVRGREVFYAPQNARASFNPVLTIGRQLRENNSCGGSALADLLACLHVADPGRVLHAYSHELSGGENQRCLLALALASGAGVLILDEPTAECDEATAAEFAALLRDQQRRRSLTVLLVSHQLRFVPALADRLCILSRGQRVAFGKPQEVIASVAHPYAREVAAFMAGE